MSATPWLEVVSPGAFASVQDAGRRGWRRVGVPWAGVLDPRLMRVANALAGNDGGAPVIECFDGGLQLAAREGFLRLAVAGDATVEVESAGERRLLSSWRSLTLAAGDVLRLRRLERGRSAVVAVEGLNLPKVLGSVSTYARAALGGIDGRALAAGARLPAAPASARPERMLAAAPKAASSTVADPIRVVAGPQADHFTAAALAGFTESAYRITTEADRMGVRLEGPALVHQGAPEIVSDATVPGSIQVPGNGQPIVLLADAQTAGGYPKIATVIGAEDVDMDIFIYDAARLALKTETATLRVSCGYRVDSLHAESWYVGLFSASKHKNSLFAQRDEHNRYTFLMQPPGSLGKG